MKDQLNKISLPEENLSYKVKPYSKNVINAIEKHDINNFFITGQLISFGSMLEDFRQDQSKFQIINKDKNISIIFKFVGDEIELVNIISTDNIYTVDGVDFVKFNK